ncbi:MAG: hypothetical protein LKG20_04600 [Tetrasphaera jenkinsii]|nr:hypothetical protein [Tetrasphaera jenkinsii]
MTQTALEPAARRPSPLAALTGLRAFAATWVVLFHFRGDLEALVPALKWRIPYGAPATSAWICSSH